MLPANVQAGWGCASSCRWSETRPGDREGTEQFARRVKPLPTVSETRGGRWHGLQSSPEAVSAGKDHKSGVREGLSAGWDAKEAPQTPSRGSYVPGWQPVLSQEVPLAATGCRNGVSCREGSSTC